jgi:hypothetical protein
MKGLSSLEYRRQWIETAACHQRLEGLKGLKLHNFTLGRINRNISKPNAGLTLSSQMLPSNAFSQPVTPLAFMPSPQSRMVDKQFKKNIGLCICIL